MQDEPCYSNDIYQHLDYLLEDWDEPREYYPYRYLKVCWDLEEFTAPLFRLLPREVLETLSEKKKVQITAQDRIYKLFYIRGKVFGITGKKREKGNIWIEGEINLYSISQYFPDGYSPKSATDVAKCGEELLYALERMGMYNPSKLTSPIKVFEESVLSHMKIPTIYDMPEVGKEASKMAMKLIDSEWRAVYKVGHFNETFDYDQVGSYPYQVSRLPDTTQCVYTKSDIVPSDYDWGLVEGRVTVENPYTPVLFDDGEKDVPVVGSWSATLTTELADWLYRHKAGKFEMKEGWFLKFLTGNRPFLAVVNRVFNYRQGSDVMDVIGKRISVGISGKFGEDFEDSGYGKLYNSIYRAMVLSRCKMQVADFIWDNKLWDNVVSVTVDGVLSDRYVPIKSSNRMGDWRFSGTYPALILGTGMQWYGDKKPLGLTYAQVIDAMREHPKQAYYSFKVKGQVTLADALKAEDLKSLGRVKDFEQFVDLATLNPNMQFEKLPRTGEQALSGVYVGKSFEIKGEQIS